MLQIKNLYYRNKSRSIISIDDLSFEPGQLYTLAGANGSGKTTLLNCISLLNRDFSGEIFFCGTNVCSLNFQAYAEMRSFMPQHNFVDNYIKVKDYVLIGRFPYFRSIANHKDLEVVNEVLNFLEINHLADFHLQELSGGEQQLCHLAKSICQIWANEGDTILLLDEPFNHLDIRIQHAMLVKLTDWLKRRSNMVCIVSMHDINLSIQYSKYISFLKGGQQSFHGLVEHLSEEIVHSVYGIKPKFMQTRQGLNNHIVF